MRKEKNFKLKAADIIDLIPPMGGCVATDRITVDGLRITRMYREAPTDESDSGWQFYSGTETQEYVDDANNWSIYSVNTIANYDKAIIPYLHFPVGTDLERVPGSDKFDIFCG
ncbi:DUF2185 domain-containing protein [Chitinophaga horti]|uniref:DUF2185 domain-containing protein n=1 Tax=Chitinophaga horti TaxID=2920382 RepID=A0ABY6J4Q5_9BACT|nr:DUF2185 domain-containing protein [Chitinophaga horti]UYQ94655.1 DUF2185 domain-containing protein [Chitinophaga horti]